MSRFFPHTPYAEDQPLARTILTTHSLTRAVTVGSLLGMGYAGVRQSIPSLRQSAPFSQRLLVCSGGGVLAGVVLTSVGVVARMWKRDTIEWQDRSWRLLENRGQIETDDWTYAGMGAALAGAALQGKKSGPARLGWRGVVGAAGLGSVAGMVGYLGKKGIVGVSKGSERGM